jgi:activator of 2-hydroxyglutaryl-CoA dehydratase
MELESRKVKVIPTKEVIRDRSLTFKAATGHLGRSRAEIYENELVVLSLGGLLLVDEEEFVLVDVGARDTKLCQFRSGKPVRLDWNQACGAATGFTLELLGRYYEIDYTTLPATHRRANVTCGVFGLEKVFDSIIRGSSIEEAVASFVHGVAYNVYTFAGKPRRIYLSGGLCLNRCFVESLNFYCDVIELGRNVLLWGLVESIRERGYDTDQEQGRDRADA